MSVDMTREMLSSITLASTRKLVTQNPNHYLLWKDNVLHGYTLHGFRRWLYKKVNEREIVLENWS